MMFLDVAVRLAKDFATFGSFSRNTAVVSTSLELIIRVQDLSFLSKTRSSHHTGISATNSLIISVKFIRWIHCLKTMDTP